ncbi:MAG: hypothetical protein JJE51_09690 [Thermoanaerobaculia bacterium]|nr:hypothetical protein [Thermoanaerobaculia bacterium]
MTIRCEQIDDLLLEGDPFSMAEAVKHAESCPTCHETLAAWNDIAATARTMTAEWQSDMLLPRVQHLLREKTSHAQRSRLWQIAAAIILTISIAATSWYAVRLGSHDARFDEDILRVAVLDEVEQAEKSHVEAIERLERIAAPTLEHSDAALMVSYKEKLLLLDDAIAECEAGIAQNRQNAFLRKQLLAMYSEKQDTLRQIVREGRDATRR